MLPPVEIDVSQKESRTTVSGVPDQLLSNSVRLKWPQFIYSFAELMSGKQVWNLSRAQQFLPKGSIQHIYGRKQKISKTENQWTKRFVILDVRPPFSHLPGCGSLRFLSVNSSFLDLNHLTDEPAHPEGQQLTLTPSAESWDCWRRMYVLKNWVIGKIDGLPKDSILGMVECTLASGHATVPDWFLMLC